VRTRRRQARESRSWLKDRKNLREFIAEVSCIQAQSVFGESVVGIAVHPSLTVFAGRDHRMPTRVRVLAGVLVGRAITATRATAFLAGTKMNPSRSNLYAVLALLPLRVLDAVDALDVLARASWRHDSLPVS
jgi:hypothetical protein